MNCNGEHQQDILTAVDEPDSRSPGNRISLVDLVEGFGGDDVHRLSVDGTAYEIRASGADEYEVSREGVCIGHFHGPNHATPHRVTPASSATVSGMREIYAVAQAFRDTVGPRCDTG